MSYNIISHLYFTLEVNINTILLLFSCRICPENKDISLFLESKDIIVFVLIFIKVSPGLLTYSCTCMSYFANEVENILINTSDRN